MTDSKIDRNRSNYQPLRSATELSMISSSPADRLLPTWHELLAALCGHRGNRPEDHLILQYAHSLGQLYLALTEHTKTDGCHKTDSHDAEFHSRRAELTAAIDLWAAINIPVSMRSMGRTQLGSAVDELADAQSRATYLLKTIDNVDDIRVHEAWFHLASLADAWADIVTAIERGCPYSDSRGTIRSGIENRYVHQRKTRDRGSAPGQQYSRPDAC
ncbi:hypothetical protein GZH49_10535 [Nocardia terpenica]